VADLSPNPAGPEFAFGPFRLLSAQQLLLNAGRPVSLGARALAILAHLIERAGEPVRKEDLLAHAWPDVVVDEGSLRAQIVALRRALGDGTGGERYVTTVPGRGYCFVAPVSRTDAVAATPRTNASAATPRAGSRSMPPLPIPLNAVLGRDDVVARLIEQLPSRRFITIVGAGGIGKTTVALAVAHEIADSYADGVYFVDLAASKDPSLTPSAVAAALGVPLRAENPVAGLVTVLHDMQLLLVLDSCEGVIDIAAILAERIVKGALGVHVLATSREALRAEGEYIRRLESLSVPPLDLGITAATAASFTAVQLFVARATASLNTFELTDTNAALVAEICRRLDGIPLAVELAAGVVDLFGLAAIARRLDDRFRLLMRGRRTALPRHRTLLATLEWSYELLPENERAVFRRLAIFAGTFSLASASAVSAAHAATEADTTDGIAQLVAKSLIAVQRDGPVARYRLLDSTRAFALDRLEQSGERAALDRAHARHFLVHFHHAEASCDRTPAVDWLNAYRPDLENLRAALDWAFAPDGDTALGIALTAAAAPLWFQLSLVAECLGRVESALAALHATTLDAKRLRMKLLSALGWSLMYTGTAKRATDAAWASALAAAEELGDIDHRLRALWGSWADHMRIAQFRTALEVARAFGMLASSADDRLVGDRMIGAALHFLGEQAEARRHIDRVLAGYLTPAHAGHLIRYQFDQRASAEMILARVLWMQGLADQAMRSAARSVEEAMRSGHVLSLCNALAQAACPVALLAGDWSEAERFIALLRATTERYGLDVWRAYGNCFQGQLLIQQGAHDAGLRLLDPAVAELRGSGFMQFQTAFHGALAEGLLLAGRIEQALAAVEEAHTRCESAQERWILPELLRLSGEIALAQNNADAFAVADDYFERSRAIAQETGALAWEMRTTTSLARVRLADARGMLATVFGRFSEGFGTADLRAATTLLSALGPPDGARS